MRFLPSFLALGVALAAPSVFSAGLSDSVGPMKSEWFTASEVAPNTWRIVDHETVNVYLVIGRERALLIDTGYGQANLRQYARSLTSLPLTVINTHGHGDHSGADVQFGAVLAHRADFASIERTAASLREHAVDTQVPAGEQFDYRPHARPHVRAAPGQATPLSSSSCLAPGTWNFSRRTARRMRPSVAG